MTNARSMTAASWVERSADGLSAQDARAFDEWHRDPANAASFARIDEGRRAAAALADDCEFDDLRRATQARIAARQTRFPRHRWLAAIAASVLVATPLAIVAVHDRPDNPAPHERVYRTPIGQRMAVTLDDGSRLTLDSDSRVRVAYSATERRLYLDRGEAMFEVAKHKQRPFIVSARDQIVTAHGTMFDVRLTHDKVRVVLVEGKVSVASPGGTVAMTPDDVLTARPGLVTLRRHSKGAELTSWRDGFLTFDDRPLAEAVEEINRYAPHPLVLADAEVGRMRISGAFRTDDTDAFVAALEEGFPVRVTTARDGKKSIESAPTKN